MTDSGLLAETKKILRSLVIPSPEGLSVDKLKREYYDMEGCTIPYSKLGYRTLESFLMNIKDTVTVRILKYI